MLSPNNYLHLVFDYDNDLHYTDTLLTLDPEAYLWYTLRCRYQYDVILFAAETSSGICLRVFDSESQCALRPEQSGFWGLFSSKSPEPRHLEPKTFRLQTLGTSEEGLLGWLLERTEAKELKKKRTALIFSLDAFETIYRASGEWGKQKLLKKGKYPDGHSILVLRISPQPKNLAEAFFREDAILPQISREIRKALDGPQEPLLDALKRQMGGQLACLYQIDDMLNMLVCHAVAADEWGDSLQEMKDQADYLQLCCRRYGRMVTEPEDGPSAAVRHREAAEWLRNAGFREALRVQTAYLRKRYPALSVLEAMKREGILPEDYQDAPLMLDYDDPLVRNIQSLCLPEAFLRIPKYSCWQDLLVQIQTNIRTLWNSPRSEMVCSWADFFYREICGAAGRNDWETLNDAMQLLRFCAEHICDGTEREPVLSTIFNNGKVTIDLSHNIFRKSDFFLPTRLPESIYSDDIDEERKLLLRFAESEKKTTLLQLNSLRGALYTAIDMYNRREVSNEAIEQIYKDLDQTTRQKAAQIAGDTKEGLQLEAWDTEDEIAQAPVTDNPLPDSDGLNHQRDRLACEQFIKRMGL